ncbi:MAG: response regulator [Saprospiraceae bacterium]|nr:response regulator [Saprospiraceae bacterium]
MKQIIWVDNDVEIMKNSYNMFNDYGFIVHTCTNLTDAYSYLKKGFCNNLLIDVEFPNSNKEGLTFLENIYKEFPSLKIIIYTGYPDLYDAVKYIKNKFADDYLQKGSLMSEEQRKIFFRPLNNTFVDYPIIEYSQEYLTYNEFEDDELWRWRKPTLIVVLTLLFSLFLSICIYLYLEKWNFHQGLINYKNSYISLIISGILFLLNIFFGRLLYDKYHSHSNIVNYINLRVKPKTPNYLRNRNEK